MFGLGFEALLFPVLSYFLISIVPVIFILVKWRMDHDMKVKDPQVGLKVLLYYFKTLSLQVLLVSAVLTIIAIIKNILADMYAFPLSFFIVGAVIYAAHLILIILFTNRSGFPTVARYFAAYTTFTVGIVSMASAIMSIIFLIQKNYEPLDISIAVCLVYIITWIIQLLILFNIPLFKQAKR
jgi:hypothetical protein